MTREASAVSVCICTRNRAESLRRTLQSLADQTYRGTWELILVDNGSTDGTRAVAEDSRGLPLRYVLEPTPGLSQARNRALAEAQSALVLFTDDDVDLEPDWLEAFCRAAMRFPAASFLGGRILPRWPGEKPRWLRDERLDLIAGLLCNYDLGEVTRELGADELQPFGASFGVRRALVDQVGLFRTDLGVRDSEPGRGEETDYFRRARSLGAQGAYVGEALCHHRVTPSRFGLPHLFRYGFHKGLELTRTRPPGEVSGSLLRALSFAVRGTRQLLIGRGDRFRQCIIHSAIQIGILSGS